MNGKAAAGGGAIGLVFLVLGLVKLARGENWVVWIILAFLFGGLSAAGTLFGGNKA